MRKATEMTVNGVRIGRLKLLSTCRLKNWSLDREDTKYNSWQNFRTAPYIIIHPYMGLYYSVYHQ